MTNQKLAEKIMRQLVNRPFTSNIKDDNEVLVNIIFTNLEAHANSKMPGDLEIASHARGMWPDCHKRQLALISGANYIINYKKSLAKTTNK